MMFSLYDLLDQVQKDRLDDWRVEQDQKVAKMQKKDSPNYGSLGGAYTYQITHTSLGMIYKVLNNYTLEEIDLTDYGSW